MGLHGVASPLSTGHHGVVDGHGEAARLGLAELRQKVSERLVFSGFVGRIVYVANHATRNSWGNGKS